ncbi:hypothetical protein B296_00036390 [Ensete ventricosum]|uniref:Uncharacterized protein n=1 Tax=Ensete ventricosum TaxID=4639 RepID=A0A426ZG17_ENSVE|nr:hypothetical protein B296_00036390 [Ensete ventricosum]
MASLVRTRPLLSRLSDRRASAVSRSYAVAAASRPSSASPKSASETPAALKPATVEEEEVPTSGICRPLSEILRELNKKVPDSLIRTRIENGVVTRHIPWFASFHRLYLLSDDLFIYYADERFFLMTVRQIYREASGTASVKDTGYGDPVQKAEAMAFRRACARLGLGLHLYHEDAS